MLLEITLTNEDRIVAPHVIYGDTDCIFIKYNIRKNGETETLKDQLHWKQVLKSGQLTSNLFFTILPLPQNMFYEKDLPCHSLFYPRKDMLGINMVVIRINIIRMQWGVSSSRACDNAPIVKIVVGGIVKVF